MALGYLQSSCTCPESAKTMFFDSKNLPKHFSSPQISHLIFVFFCTLSRLLNTYCAEELGCVADINKTIATNKIDNSTFLGIDVQCAFLSSGVYNLEFNLIEHLYLLTTFNQFSKIFHEYCLHYSRKILLVSGVIFDIHVSAKIFKLSAYQ